MNAMGMERILGEAVALAEQEIDELRGARIQTREEAGMLTRDRGMVLRLADGSEFQIIIVQSK
jgi:hypothetical protein